MSELHKLKGSVLLFFFVMMMIRRQRDKSGSEDTARRQKCVNTQIFIVMFLVKVEIAG